MSDTKKPSKILICCGINGCIKSFVDHIEGLFVKKGTFDYVFCVGDFFGDCDKEWLEFKESGNIVSVPVYVLGPNKKEHEKYFINLQDQQLAPNIFYLGKDGVFKTSDGLKIGYISGIESNKAENEIHTYNFDSISHFKESCVRNGIVSLDILLTSPWPFDVRKKERTPANLKIKEPTKLYYESHLLSWVAIDLTPRYHFSGLQGVFYQRSPYKNCNSNTVTRFIGLGDFNEQKYKWLYGFLLSPIELASANKINYTVTESPYADNPSHYITHVLPSTKQYFYNTSTNINYVENGPSKKKKYGAVLKQSTDINTNNCWFCLSSKNITKHMVVSISDNIYIAGNKGPLVKEHILIATVAHYKSFPNLPPEAEKEINLIKSCLNQYFESTGRLAVYFERNILSAHYQLQVVPVPKRMADRLENVFKNKFSEYNLSLVDIPPAASLRQIAANNDENYFYAELPNGKRLFHSAFKKTGSQQEQKFPLHIAREILASPRLLNVEDRIDWKKCDQSKIEEETDVNLFRMAFAPFNPIKD